MEDTSVVVEPLVNIESIINQFFGQAYDTAVYDMALLFCFIILFIFIFCILGLLFRPTPRK